MGSIPKLGRHKPTGQWRVHSRRFGDIYFGVDPWLARQKYEAWRRERFGDLTELRIKPQALSSAVAQFLEGRSRWMADCLRPFVAWSIKQKAWMLEHVSAELVAHYAEHLRTVKTPRPAPKGEPRPMAPLSAWTQKHYLSALNEWLRWAGGLAYVPRDLKARGRSVPRSAPKSINTAKLAETVRIAKGPASRLIRFLYLTGARPGEAVRLRWPDIDLHRKIATLLEHKAEHSTGTARVIRLSDEAISTMGRPLKSDRLVFKNRRGGAYTVSGLRSIVRKAGITTYQLRHTFAQDLLDRGTPIDVVSELLGHRSIRTTQRYTHVREARLRRYLTLDIPIRGRRAGRGSRKTEKSADQTVRPRERAKTRQTSEPGSRRGE